MDSSSQDAVRREGPAASRTDRPVISEGAEFQIPYPFKREEYRGFDEEGGFTHPTWNPGWSHEACAPDDMAPVWQGEGLEIRTVVSVHKPGRFPTRVFYTRRWRDPSGKEFGKSKLLVTTEGMFRQWMRGGLLNRLRRERERPGLALADSRSALIAALVDHGEAAGPSPLRPSPDAPSEPNPEGSDLTRIQEG